MKYTIIRVDTPEGPKDQIMLDNGDETHTEILVDENNTEYANFLKEIKNSNIHHPWQVLDSID
jgi:hypothetical protein